MSTTPAPDLPPEVLDEIFAYSILSLSHMEASSTLAVFSVGARGWTGIAQRRMLSNVVVTGGKQIKALIRGTARVDRGGAAQSLEVRFMPNGRGVIVPNAREIEQNDLVSMDDFVTLLKQTPRLKRLVLINPTFTRFRRRDLQDLAGVFSSLTELEVDLKDYDTSFDVLRSVLEVAVLLKRLAVRSHAGINSSVPPLSTYPSRIKSLELSGAHSHNAFINQLSPLIPVAALHDLEELTFASQDLHYQQTSDAGSSFFQAISGLKKLKDTDTSLFPPNPTPFVLAHLSQLEELRGFTKLDSDTLNALPATVKYLECVEHDDAVDWFRSLTTNPQPSTFAVEHVWIGNLRRADFVAALPSTIKTVRTYGGSPLLSLGNALELVAVWDRLRQLDELELLDRPWLSAALFTVTKSKCQTENVKIKVTVMD